mmetsp:Transcript_15360/g.38709  ORF Transcript_15360/g.38709 Transcript_15360/m.38709 type:complete len:325 (-) Transcript_15360:569-1543(-)
MDGFGESQECNIVVFARGSVVKKHRRRQQGGPFGLSVSVFGNPLLGQTIHVSLGLGTKAQRSSLSVAAPTQTVAAAGESLAHVIGCRGKVAGVYQQGNVGVPAAVPSKGGSKSFCTPFHARSRRFEFLGLHGRIPFEPVSIPDGSDHPSVLVHSRDQIVADLGPPQITGRHVPAQTQIAGSDGHAVGRSPQDGPSGLGAVSSASQTQEPSIQSASCPYQYLVFNLGKHEGGPSSKGCVFERDHSLAGQNVAVFVNIVYWILFGLFLAGVLDNLGGFFHVCTAAGVQTINGRRQYVSCVVDRFESSAGPSQSRLFSCLVQINRHL